MRLARQSVGVARMHLAATSPDGVYCYASRTEMDADADGSSARAVVTRCEADE
jgi:hypothetical protein